MAVFKCKMCGGTIEFAPGDSVGICDSCGTKQTLPRLDSDKKAQLYDRADHFRRNNEFDKAMGIYEQILNEDEDDAEAYWSLVLCKYGIEYVEDPATHRRIPTVNRAQYTSIFDDEDYKAALQHADGHQREIYEQEAGSINEIQKGILAISAKEEPFDVFICYKETDANGRRTPDSVLANDLYHQLTQEGFKVFFARITLEDKLGSAYEPYIFAALNSAKVMVVLGTRPAYFQAAWVKNEWSRYLALVKESGGKKILIPAYKDMDPYDLPDEFSHLQAQDMSKLGFMQDLIRGIGKIIGADGPKSAPNVHAYSDGADKANLLKRAELFLLDGDTQNADAYCEKVLDIDPECAEAYLYKAMAEVGARAERDMGKQSGAWENNINYRKAVMFGSEDLQSRLKTYDLRCKYNYACALQREENYSSAKRLFEKIRSYEDAEEQIKKCERLIAEREEACEKRQEEREREECARSQREEQLSKEKEQAEKEIRKQSNANMWLGTLMAILAMFAIIFCAVAANDVDADVTLFLVLGTVVAEPILIVAICMVSKKKQPWLAKLKEVNQMIAANNRSVWEPDVSLPEIHHFPDIGSVKKTQMGSGAVKAEAIPKPAENTKQIILLDAGVDKIQTIGAIRRVTGLGLAEAKALTDRSPSVIMRSASSAEAAEIRYELEKAGAKVEIR